MIIIYILPVFVIILYLMLYLILNNLGLVVNMQVIKGINTMIHIPNSAIDRNEKILHLLDTRYCKVVTWLPIHSHPVLFLCQPNNQAQ